MNKIQRKKRKSSGVSSLSKTIDEDDSDDSDNKSNINESVVKSKYESGNDNSLYKYLINKNDINYQNFNTERNKYEEDSDASSYYDESDEYISTDNDNRKESFESQLKKNRDIYIKGGKSSIGEKKSSSSIVVSKKINSSLPVPTLPARKSSTSNLTTKIRHDAVSTSATKEKLMYKEKPINPSQMVSNISSPPTRSVSASSNGSPHVRATSPLTMYSRVNEDLKIEDKPKKYNIVKNEPVLIENNKSEKYLKYKSTKNHHLP